MNASTLQYNLNKLRAVANRNGESNVRQQQGTTRAIYDSIDLATAGTSPVFFRDANSRTFPFTNVPKNSFSDGISMLIQRVYFCIVSVNAGVITAINPVRALFPQFAAAELSILVAGQEVLQRFPMLSTQAEYNKDARFGAVSQGPLATDINRMESSVFNFDLDVVILPNREFTAAVQLPAFTAPAPGTRFLRLNLEGVGTVQKVGGNI
jgi:hypothetical protein